MFPFQVIKAYDHKYQQYVALKLVRNEKRFHRQAEEEIRILDHLRRQDTDAKSVLAMIKRLVWLICCLLVCLLYPQIYMVNLFLFV